MEPTLVVLKDGSTYSIPSGARGSYPWVRQASLISVAYGQIGDAENKAKWAKEHLRRNAIWNALQSGKDALSVVAQFGSDLLLAPVRIVADIGNAAIKVGKTATDTFPAVVMVAGVALVYLLLKEARR